MTTAQTAALAATRTRDILIVAFGLALAAATHFHGGSLPRTDCAWTDLNHSGVEECHLAGPPPAPPASFMSVDTTSHLEL